jgi:4-hydroxy-tetrahydrodipicolinate reductase
MGQVVCRAITEDPELDLVAAVDPRQAGTPLGALAGIPELPLRISDDVEELGRAAAQVAVDFTVAASALSNMSWCAGHGVHGVVGTSGMSGHVLDELARAFAESTANCLVVPNFAIGAVLLMRLAALAAPYMDGVEIVELHHDGKTDAPSGTAVRTAELLDAARQGAGLQPWPADPTTVTTVPGTRGGQGPGGVRIHSVRLPGLVAHQEVVFGARGQSLAMRHDSYDRTSFMPGVLLAVREVGHRPGLTVGLEALLGF